MQPTFRHVPPNLNSPRGSCHCSIHATEYPSCAARIAAIQPPGPAPITMTSNDLDMMIDFFLSNFTVHLRRDCADISGMRGYRQIEYRHLDINGLTVIIADSSNHQAQTRLFDFFNLILHLFALPQVAHISSGDQYQRICDLTALQ